jgi:hypothetical protein
MGAVATKKVSVTLDAEVLKEAREAARIRGMSLSAWPSEAAHHAARIEDGQRAVKEWEDENGAFTEEERQAARRVIHIIDVSRRG